LNAGASPEQDLKPDDEEQVRLLRRAIQAGKPLESNAVPGKIFKIRKQRETAKCGLAPGLGDQASS